MTVSVGPFPWMTTLALMSRSPVDASAAVLVLVMVREMGMPLVAVAKLMMQGAFGGAQAGVAFSLMTASRRVQSVEAAVTQVGGHARRDVVIAVHGEGHGAGHRGRQGTAQRAVAARNASIEIVDRRSADVELFIILS